jgi:hypothetical protein
MRLKWTIVGFVLLACLTLKPAYAATEHAHGPKATGKPPTTGKPTSGATTGPTSTSPSIQLNPIAAKISSKPQLGARITAMLPKGMTLNQASMGFKNQGQFIAALHVSQNLGCDCFKQLQTDMTKKHMSLGQAIQDVKKTANSGVEVRKAETEANDDVKTVTTTSAPASTGKNNKNTTRGDQ